MGLYVTEEQVKVRLGGRVRFTEDAEEPGEENKMTLALLRQIIADGEAQVEQDLSSRYAAPFQTDAGQPFSSLREHPTRKWIQTLCLLQCVIRAMETDFGSGGPVDSSKFTAAMEKRYKAMVDSHFKMKENSYNTYINPPLPDLRLSYQNEEADSGFKGRVLTTNTDPGAGDFAAGQINSPGDTFWLGDINSDLEDA